jgi:hypothetical protein
LVLADSHAVIVTIIAVKAKANTVREYPRWIAPQAIACGEVVQRQGVAPKGTSYRPMLPVRAAVAGLE